MWCIEVVGQITTVLLLHRVDSIVRRIAGGLCNPAEVITYSRKAVVTILLSKEDPSNLTGDQKKQIQIVSYY